MGEASNDYNKALREHFAVLGMSDFRSFLSVFFSQVRQGEGGPQKKGSDL